MKTVEFKNFLKEAYRIGNQNVLVQSKTGIGKSSIVMQVADELGIELIDLRAAYLERPDILGLPYLDNGKMNFARPEMLEKLFTDFNGILFFDEMNRGDNSVMNCLMQICTDRKINTSKVVGNWLIVAAINPSDDEYIGAGEVDKALLDRFITLTLEFNHDQLFDYLHTKHGDGDLLDFYKATYNYERSSMSPRKVETSLKYEYSNMLQFVMDAVTYNKWEEWTKKIKPVKFKDLKNDLSKAEKDLAVLSKMERWDVLSITKDNLLLNINDVTEEMIDVVKEHLPADMLYLVIGTALKHGSISKEYVSKDIRLKEALNYLRK